MMLRVVHELRGRRVVVMMTRQYLTPFIGKTTIRIVCSIGMMKIVMMVIRGQWKVSFRSRMEVEGGRLVIRGKLTLCLHSSQGNVSREVMMEVIDASFKLGGDHGIVVTGGTPRNHLIRNPVTGVHDECIRELFLTCVTSREKFLVVSKNY